MFFRHPTSKALFVMLASAAVVAICGCGLPGPAQPPSLNLPDEVTDLSAERIGSAVELRWTNPTLNTDRSAIHKPVTAVLCRKPAPTAPCAPIATLPVAVGQEALFRDELPSDLGSGPVRSVEYAVTLKNSRGAFAGEGNSVRVAAGAAPGEVQGLSATNIPDGVLLRWSAGGVSEGELIRIRRTAAAPAKGEAEQQTLEVSGAADIAKDTQPLRNETYSYTVQPVLRARVEDGSGAHYLEVPGPISAPVAVRTEDVFAPGSPTGVSAVAGSDAGKPYIDLGWMALSDAGVASYLVCRTEAGEAQSSPVCRSTAGPVNSFHDLGVQPGKTYSYTVAASGANGKTSAASQPITESVPAP